MAITVYTYNDKVLKNVATDKWLKKATPIDPYNPLGLPANTIRCKFNSGYTPTMGDTQTLVDSTNNVWDIYKESNDWTYLFINATTMLEVLGANTTNVTVMTGTFYNCANLTNMALFDTSNVTNMYYFCANSSNLTYIPLFNTSKVTNVNFGFNSCPYVTGGALALYQQMTTQTNPPSDHVYTFFQCGNQTTTGAAELAQIPSSWGGTAS